MKNNISSEYIGSPKSSSKPYERKIGINKITPKNFFTENNIDIYEDNGREKFLSPDKNIQTQNEPQLNDQKNLKEYILTEEYKKNATENSETYQNNFEYNSQDKYFKKNNFTEINNNENENFSSQNNNDMNYIKKGYQIKYIEGDNFNEDNNDVPKYNYKYKYKKFQKDEQNIEYDDDKNKEKEEVEVEQNEEEEIKEDKEKIDLQELKKKPGRIIHQSVKETYDEEGNRIRTTKTIKEFSQNTPGFCMKNIHQSKERKEYERHTTNNIKNTAQKNKDRKTNLSYKNRINNNNNKGDRIYLLAQLAKIKNDSEKKKKNKFYSTSISPIIIHESNGYENQNSAFTPEIIDPNSFDRETYERSNYNYNYNYPTNYGRINLNNMNEDECNERCYYSNVAFRRNNMNQMNEEYCIENDEINNRRNELSPIGYIATYSSGSEENEEIDRSYDICKNRINNNYNNYLTTYSRIRKNKSRHKCIKEGELVKKREITYEIEDPNDYNNKKNHNLSGLEIKAQIDTSKSDKKDFQSPDRAFGAGSDRFRKVTMAMISSLGPSCEDRKITRKMRNEIGGVVDLRYELNPVNNYKIKKVKRFGFNLNKEVNPKIKIENARIIQYWWRMLRERKYIRIKIIKIQAIIRGFLIRNRILKSAKIYTAFEIIKMLFYKHFRDMFLKSMKNSNQDKLKYILTRIINKLDVKNRNKKLIKYFFKYKFITNLLNKQNNYTEITQETKITEEMYINYIKSKYLKSNTSQHINELSIKESEKNNDYNKSQNQPIEQKKEINKSKGKLELTKNEDFNIIDIKPELQIDNIEEYNILKNKKVYKDEETQKKPDLKEQGINPIIVENKIIKNEYIKLINKKKETAEKGTSSNTSVKSTPKKICKNEKISYIRNIKKVDKGQQMDKKYNIIKRNESINIISKKPTRKYYNTIKRSESFKIINSKKIYQDEEKHHITEKNTIQNETFEIIREKPKTKDGSCQYIPSKSKICRSSSYSVLTAQKKKIYYTIRKNNFSIIKKRKNTQEKGEQCNFEQKLKTNEIKIGNNIQRENIQKIYEIIEKYWKKKQFKKFIKNWKSKIKEGALRKELIRMALLKWRFIKGYGGDRYGIIYDRNGKKIGEKEGEIKDISIQNDLDEEINNSKLRKKNSQIRVISQKPVYIKSNISKKKTVDVGTGDGVNHILNEKVVNIVNLAYKRKQKGVNKISGKNYFKITKPQKSYKNQGTSMIPTLNKIEKVDRMFINNDHLNNKQYRKRDLLLQIISKCIIREKYKFNDVFTNWYKKTMRIIEQERKRKLSVNKSIITKNEKFQIINKKEKRDKSCGNIYVPNKIQRTSKMEIRQKKLKKDEGILASFPHVFVKENLKSSKINNDIYKSKKSPIILRKTQSESTTILASDKKILTKEHLIEITQKRTQILFKLITTRKTPEFFLRKYFNIWRRKVQYLILMTNAEIIGDFCKSKLNEIKAHRRWIKLYKKYSFHQRQNNIMKIIKKLKTRKDKILQLIRISTLIKFYNQRAFLHKIIMYWFLYSINASKKRNQMKIIYKNMLTTYMSMADDFFGKNQKNNPSIQDCMFEIVDSNKYQVKELEDVPMAKTYYSKKKEEKKVITNIKYITKNLEEEKETTIYKETSKYFYPKKYRENLILNKKLNNTENKRDNLSSKINLSFNYNDNSIFDNNKNVAKNTSEYTPNPKRYNYKDYSKINNISGNNNYSLNNSSYSNNINTNDYSYKYRKDNSAYKIYNNNDSNVSYNRININNNYYSNIKKDDKDNVLYKGIFNQKQNYINNNNYSDNKTFNYDKYSLINKYNNNKINLNRNYNNYSSNLNERLINNNKDLNNNKNYSSKIKPEEKSKYISNYYRRNLNNFSTDKK